MADTPTREQLIAFVTEQEARCVALRDWPLKREPKLVRGYEGDARMFAAIRSRLEAAPYGSEVLCEGCARTFCPHGERLHFHHDGCPACVGRSEATTPPRNLTEAEAQEEGKRD